jgi:septal ring factor EnvC (AmiA/AmiB activator)
MMTNEELEKKIEFIVEQQAQFTADIQKLQEAQARTDQIVNRLATATLNRFETTDKRVDDIDDRISALVNSQVRTEENVKKTDENLRNLIAVVDRYFHEGRNGNSEE